MNKFKELFIGLLLMFVSIVVVLCVGEIFVRLFWATPGYTYPQVLHEKDPILGWVQIPDQNSYTWDVPAKINSHGLRDDEFNIEKDRNTFRILALGDSVTFGVLVEGDKTYSNQLERKLNATYAPKKFEVINTGVQRYSTYQELDYLKYKGIQFDPDMVVIGFYYNDFGLRPVTWERDYENSREKYMSMLAEKAPFIANILKNSSLVGFLRDRYLKLTISEGAARKRKAFLGGIEDEKMEKQWEAAKEYLSEFKDIARQNNFKLLLIAIPGAEQVFRDYPDADYPDRLEEIAQELDIQYFDVLPVFKKHHDGDSRTLYFRYNNHPNEFGHKLIADAIFENLNKDKTVKRAILESGVQ